MHEVPYKLSKRAIINRVFEKAPAALPALVNLGHQLAQVDPKDLADVMDYIQTLVPELDSRIVLGYTLTLCSAMTVGYMHYNYITMSTTLCRLLLLLMIPSRALMIYIPLSSGIWSRQSKGTKLDSRRYHSERTLLHLPEQHPAPHM